MILALAILLGFLLDQVLGDPPSSLHPVRWIGKLVQVLEIPLRQWLPDRLAGVLLVLLVVAVTGLAVWGLLVLAVWCHPYVWFGFSALLIYLGLAARGLADHAEAVRVPLECGDLERARGELGKIVGRDTRDLGVEQIARGCVETVAENTTDAIVAPLLYAALAGPVGLWVYKAINTLDSMVGYRNEQYLRFGWAAARLDDLANFIPARLTLLLMPLAALLTGHRAWQSLKVGWRDGRKHPSPNAGLAEAAMAGALRVQLGGPSTYAGLVSDKPYLGEPIDALKPVKIRQAVGVMKMTAQLALLTACGLALAREAVMASPGPRYWFLP